MLSLILGCLLKRLKRMSESEVTQSYLNFWDHMHCSLPGFSSHGIFQARVLEWVVVSFSRGSSRPGIKPRSPALWTDVLPSESPGKIHLSSSEMCLNSWYFYFINLKVYFARFDLPPSYSSWENFFLQGLSFLYFITLSISSFYTCKTQLDLTYC